MDRRRLEAGHIKYAILTVATLYPVEINSPITFSPDLNETLLEFTPTYQTAFHKKYSGTTHATCIYTVHVIHPAHTYILHAHTPFQR